MLDIEKIDWKKCNGLVPVIVQDADCGSVLMMGYMNEDAINKTTELGEVIFYSRRKKRLWRKGESSGNILSVVDIFIDCDGDTLLIKVKPQGPTCHVGTTSCFGEQSLAPLRKIAQLESTIESRAKAKNATSYTVELLQEGVPRIAQKVGEEAVEVVVAAIAQSKQALCDESADLLYHLLVLLQAKNLKFADVVSLL